MATCRALFVFFTASLLIISCAGQPSPQAFMPPVEVQKAVATKSPPPNLPVVNTTGTAAAAAGAAATSPAQTGTGSGVVTPPVHICASKNAMNDTSSSSAPNSTSQNIIKLAFSVNNAVGRLLGFAAGCLPAGTQLQKSNITIVFEFVPCSLSTDPSTLFSRYVKATLVSESGAVLRSSTGANCTVRNSARLAKTIASHMFGSCGVAPAIANGTLPNAICIEMMCYTADPTSTQPSPPSLSPSPDAAAAAASPAANATAAAGSIGPCAGGRRRNGRVAADPLAKFDLSDVVVGIKCCADEPLTDEPLTSVASMTTEP